MSSKPQAHVGQMKQISFRGRQLLSTRTRPRSWSPASQWLLLLLMPSVSQSPPKSPSPLAGFITISWTAFPRAAVSQNAKYRQNEIFGGQTVALYRYQMPSAFKTTDSCPWYKTYDISGVLYPKKRSEKKREGDLVTGSLHHGSSETWSYRHIYRPADRIQIIRRPSR